MKTRNMTLQKAALADYGAVLAFYDDVIERTPEIGRYARWQKGKHPTAEGIRSFIEEGSMYLYRERDIVGAMVVTLYQGEDYHAIEWLKDVADNEVAVIHLLAVSPDRQSEGIGSGMVMEAIRTARDHGMRSVRLDALSTNTPAHRIYEGLGFEYRGKQHLYAENTGWTDFYFFELNETKKTMKRTFGICGIDCEKCDAFIATRNNDQALREKTAKLWAELNNAPILPEHINCEGCRKDGAKTFFCSELCAVRRCALEKGFETCGDCPDKETCPKVGEIWSNNAQARVNLQ